MFFVSKIELRSHDGFPTKGNLGMGLFKSVVLASRGGRCLFLLLPFIIREL